MKNFLKITISLFMIFVIGCSRSNRKSVSPSDPGKTDQTTTTPTPKVPIHIQKFNDLVQQIRQFTESIPHDSKSYFAGKTYNTFLRNAYDPFSAMRPVADPIPVQKYFGIGTEVTIYKNKEVNGLITRPFKGSPSKKAGLKKGDVIVAVDGIVVDEFSEGTEFIDGEKNSKIMQETVDRILGPAGTEVELTVLNFCDNYEQERKITITRGPILRSPNPLEDSYFVNLHEEEILRECPSQPEPSQDPTATNVNPGKKENKKVSFEALYVPLQTFENYSSSQGQLCEEFIKLQLKDLENPLSVGMIVDLRGNPGGSLQEVSCMLNTIIPSNEPMVNQLAVRKGKLLKDSPDLLSIHFTEGGYYDIDNHSNASYNRNIVVLIDNASASASEIFSGTIQEMKRGWVVGLRTVGKGTVQTIFPRQFNQGRGLHESLTTGIYTLNSGRSPQGYGIIPDFSFSRTGEPVEVQADDVSSIDKIFFNNIQFENNVWRQNRPDELNVLKNCVNKDGKLNKAYKENGRGENYNHPFMADYHVELAKDILLCSDVRDDIIEWPNKGGFPAMRKENSGIIIRN